MRREELTEKILDCKRAKGWTWKHIAAEIGGHSAVLITAALLGRSTTRIVEGVGHFPWVEARGAVREIVAEFLGTVGR